MKIVFIADAHLKGFGDPAQEELTRFLDTLSGVDILVILGDLFDFWTGFNGVVYHQYLPVLSSLMKLREKGTEVIYLEGNHDFSMGPFFTGVLRAKVYPDLCELDVQGRKFFLAHGDRIGMSPGYRVWRGFLRSPFFRFLTKVAPPGVFLKVASFLSSRSRNYSKKGHGIERRLKNFAREKIQSGTDSVILAHSHISGVHREEVKGRSGFYANPGGWINERSYLTYTDGNFKVERF